ncbi:MAG: hypothetical protein ACMXYK_02060 [Candidatus Woesearchaeota archaeon]
MQATEDTGNFHVFFPEGCYRKKPTERRALLFQEIDTYIKKQNFDLETFFTIKKQFIDSLSEGSGRIKNERWDRLNALILPVFEAMLTKGFTKEELRNYGGEL